MPYARPSDIPPHLRSLGLPEANRWASIFDALREEGKSEEDAARVAWSRLREGPSLRKATGKLIGRFLPGVRFEALGKAATAGALAPEDLEGDAADLGPGDESTDEVPAPVPTAPPEVPPAHPLIGQRATFPQEGKDRAGIVRSVGPSGVTIEAEDGQHHQILHGEYQRIPPKPEAP